MRRFAALVTAAALLALVLSLGGHSSKAGQSARQRIASGTLRPAVLHVAGGLKVMPMPTGGIEEHHDGFDGTSTGSASHGPGVGGISVSSLGCRDRAGGRNVRVNQDCTYRRQAEEDIAVNPLDDQNMVAGMNDSITGWNLTSLDFSTDGGKHWGAISTAPFGYRLNAPEDLLPTKSDPNRHTILGTPGTLHRYDACSDPYLAYDSRGRAFYSCVAFDIVDFAALIFVVPSPPNARGSYFDQVYPPFGLIPGASGREHVVSEDNSPGASYDAPKVAADSYVNSRNRDNVYSTFTSFDLTCGKNHDQYCESPVYGSMSTDHGLTWSTPQKISGRNPAVCKFGNAFNKKLPADSCNLDGHSDIQVLPNGDLAVTFISQNSRGQSPEILSLHCRPGGSSPAGTANLHCGTPHRVVIQQVADAPQCDLGRGPEQCSPGAFIRVPFETSQRLAVDEHNGDLYDSWYDYRRGEFDIFVSRSTDGGRTWSAPRRVNRDTGTDHYFAAVDVAERGGTRLGIGYYRTGRVPHENRTPKGGFTKDDPGVAKRLSDYVLAHGRPLSTPFAFDVLAPKTPAPDGIQEGFNGDYSGISISRTNMAHVVWSDTRVRVHQAALNRASVDEDVYTDVRRIGGR